MKDPSHARLIELGEKIREHEKWTRDLALAESKLQRLDRELETLGAALEAEARDVRKLEGLSLTALFHSVLGGKGEKLEKERQELLAAKLRYDEHLESSRALREHAAALRARIAGAADLEVLRRQLLDERETFLRRGGGPRSSRLAAIAEQLAGARADLHELEEAVDAGQRAALALDEVVAALSSAGGWGTLDMFGGGLLTTAMKHGRIDEARRAAERAQRILHQFASELEDLGRHGTGLVIEIGGFAKFADYFFDGLIFDWVVQSKISRSHDKAVDVRRSTRDLVHELTRRAGEARAAIATLEEERQRLLEQE